MKKYNFNSDWKFLCNRIEEGSSIVSGEIYDVTLPHDYMIFTKMNPKSDGGSAIGFYSGGDAIYTKEFEVDASYKNKTVILEFEGVYMNSTVYINDQIVAKHPYGYTSFTADCSNYLIYPAKGEEGAAKNLIKVEVNNNSLPNSRWYSGAGIYRNVNLYVGDGMFVAPWDVSITTPDVLPDKTGKIGSAKINIDITVSLYQHIMENGYAGSILRYSVEDSGGRSIINGELPTDTVYKKNDGIKPRIFAATPGYEPERRTFEISFSAEEVKLWSADNPEMYYFKYSLHKKGVFDGWESRIPFGVRKIDFSAKEGFRLNGISVKMRGGCVHHDCGLLGAAAFNRAEERKIELLKKSGFNAVRCAHNPPSKTFLDCCDRMGMLVINEIFDCWNNGKNPYDYNLYFDRFWETDLTSMILRDRNHPSIIMWSIGNEIVERDAGSNGLAVSRMLANKTRELDPARPVTGAVCEFWSEEYTRKLLNQKVESGIDGFQYEDISTAEDCWGEVIQRFTDSWDVVGYNYLVSRYKSDNENHKDRIIYGSETFPLYAFDYWEATENNIFVIGDFVWTALDYLGEAGIGHMWYDEDIGFMGNYPWNQANCGDIDICGFKRPQSYYRDCILGIADKPYIAVFRPQRYGQEIAAVSPWGWHDVFPSWSWPGYEGKPIKLQIYSRDDEVELFVNGCSKGRLACGRERKYIVEYDIIYLPGEIKAVSYKDGKPAGERILRTPGQPAKLKLTADRNEITGCEQDGDLAYITVELTDDDGNPVSHNDDKVIISVEGPGKLQALGSNNPKTDEGYCTAERRLNFGKAMAVIRPVAVGKICEKDNDIIVKATTLAGHKGECRIRLK